MKREIPMGVSPADDERMQRAIRVGKMRKDQPSAAPVEEPMPTIVMPPPPAASRVDPVVEDIFDFGGGDSADDEPTTDPAQVVVPRDAREETGFVLLPSEKK